MQSQQLSEKKIILVGNPNVGKSVVFNTLTGSYTTVSNYPGTSVEVSRGHCQIANESYLVLDTPGMYSLLPITEEERVARRILLEESPYVVLHVIDARNLERMLPMTLQLIEAGLPVVLLVNIMDEADRVGMNIDIPLLQEKLQIPVVGGSIGRGKKGLWELREALDNYQPRQTTFVYATDLEKDILRISTLLQGDYILSKRSLALMLLQRDDEISQRVQDREGEQYASVQNTVNDTVFDRRVDLHLRISLERKRICKGLLDGVVTRREGEHPAFADRFSSWTMNPWTGIPLLLMVLYLGLYQFVGGFGAGTIVDFLEGTIIEEFLNPWVIGLCDQYIPWYWLKELLVGEYGLFTLGVRYAVAIILPIVGTFFIAFAVIEDSGYFPRLAMLVDRIFKKIGLNGRAVIPMVLGFGCDTMATVVTRTLESTRE